MLMMKKGIIIICSVVISVGCATKPPPVRFFDVDAYTKPYQKTLHKPLTIVLDEAILDEFLVEGRGLREMEVYNFRKSLRISLYYTFVDTYSEVHFSDQIDTSGITLHLYRIRPSWDIKSTSTSVYGTEVVVSSTSYEVATLVRYDGVLYQHGEKRLVIDNEVASEKTTFSRRQGPEVFKDAMREMCEDLYKTLVSVETNADKASGN